MKSLKLIGQAILQRVKQICSFPRAIANAFQQKQRQSAPVTEQESERLDRLRNPSKYRGV